MIDDFKTADGFMLWLSAARDAVNAHEDGEYRAAADYINSMMTWSATPQGQDFWGGVEDDLVSGAPTPRPDAIAIIKGWLGQSVTAGASKTMEATKTETVAVVSPKMVRALRHKMSNGHEFPESYARNTVYYFDGADGVSAASEIGNLSPDKMPEGGAFWKEVQAGLRAQTITPAVEKGIAILRALVLGNAAPTIKPNALGEDQVYGWLHERGLSAIKTDELKILKRNGTSGPPQIDRATLNRMRF